MVRKKRSARKSVVSKKSQASYDSCLCSMGMSCAGPLHPIHLGMALGITWGVAIFAMSAMGIQTGASTFVGLIFKQYISMPTAIAGGIFALIYGFIDGFFGGLIIGSLYNFLNKNCKLC